MGRQYAIDSKTVLLPDEIDLTRQIDGIHYVLFEGRFLAGDDKGRNIWAFDANGKFLWKIQPLPLSDETVIEYWISIYQDKSGRIAVMNCDDNIVHVDPKTGDLYRTDGVKIPRVRTMAEWKNPP
ncbi:MAG: hypothetical protein AB7F86_12230 [Bdellovibrionales bacterium]